MKKLLLISKQFFWIIHVGSELVMQTLYSSSICLQRSNYIQNDQLVSLMGNFNIDLCGYKPVWELTAYNVDEPWNECFSNVGNSFVIWCNKI